MEWLLTVPEFALILCAVATLVELVFAEPGNSIRRHRAKIFFKIVLLLTSVIGLLTLWMI